ncbi:MAG: 2-oxoacid:acceptor oxidoreductase family protein [Proteobacteria bacterium]|nr:2-oxoacid:acceptor oxidoreductase family protein [Pseudomonadota bacterium]
MRRCDVLLAGIGGQGVITLGTLLKLAALREGVEVVGAERRGGAQREGPVTSTVRYRILEEGERRDPRKLPFGGEIPPGGAHLLVSLEPLEAARCLPYLNHRSVVIAEVTPRAPTAVRLGAAAYPPLGTLWDRLREVTPHVHPVALEETSRDQFGDLRRVNVLALGLASALGNLPVSEEALLEVVRERLPDVAGNRRAFAAGKELARS